MSVNYECGLQFHPPGPYNGTMAGRRRLPDPDPDSPLGVYLHGLLTALKWSAYRLQKESGISISQITGIIKGKRGKALHEPTVAAIADALARAGADVSIGAMRQMMWLRAPSQYVPIEGGTESRSLAEEVREMKGRIDALWLHHRKVLEAEQAARKAAKAGGRKNKRHA